MDSNGRGKYFKHCTDCVIVKIAGGQHMLKRLEVHCMLCGGSVVLCLEARQFPKQVFLSGHGAPFFNAVKFSLVLVCFVYTCIYSVLFYFY